MLFLPIIFIYFRSTVISNQDGKPYREKSPKKVQARIRVSTMLLTLVLQLRRKQVWATSRLENINYLTTIEVRDAFKKKIGNTPVLLGGSSKKFPKKCFANSAFFVGKKG